VKEWLDKNLNWISMVVSVVVLVAIVLSSRDRFWERRTAERPQGTPTVVVIEKPTPTPPATVAEMQQLLTRSIVAAADYLVVNQLSNGELPYQVDITTGDRSAPASHIRLIAGAGSLYTACRVADDDKYCRAGDLALLRYLGQVIEGENFPGACFYSRGGCMLGGNAIAIDAIYRRWQATGDYDLGDTDLLDVALRLGENIAWMHKEDGSFYHLFDPHFGGGLDEDYNDIFFQGEGLMALLELYQMTDAPYWLRQARQADDYMLQQPVSEDHWHAYSFRLFAVLDDLTAADATYATRIGQAIIDGQGESLVEDASSISNATKVEALSALAIALREDGQPHEWLAPEMEKFATFVMARQLPNHRCNWLETGDLSRFEGGIYSTCAEPIIRVDAQQHWINGAATYLEYLHQAAQ
jgi:hypothetical protein